MNGKSVTAWVFVAMMLLMLAPMPQPTVLKDEAVVQHVALSSDMVVNFSYTISGGAEVVDMAYAHDHYYVALAHNGVGIIGNYTWLGTTPGGLLVKIAHNGTVMGTAHAPYRPLKLVVSDDFAVMIGEHPSTGLFLEAFKPDMNLQAQRYLYSVDSNGANADLVFYDLSIDRTDAYVMVGCPAPLEELTFFQHTCSTENGRTGYTLAMWDIASNSVGIVSRARYFDIGPTSMNYFPSETDGGYDTIGPNPDCPQSIYAHNGTVESIANAHCGGRKLAGADHAASLFGSTSTWSVNPNDFEISMGLTFSTYQVAHSTEFFDGEIIGFEACNSGIDIEVDMLHHGGHSALMIHGWSGGDNNACSLIEHEAADAGDTTNVITTFRGRGANMGLLGTNDFSNAIPIKSTRDILDMVATSSDGTGWAGVCHTGSLADDNVAIVIGGQIEQISLISWQSNVIINVTSHNVNAGCPEALVAGNGEVLMLQNDGITQTLTFFGQDADGDGYGLSTDDFPNDANQWSDNDGDGFGDNLGFFNSDDCPYAAGNSTIGRKGCADSDGDGRSDFTDVFPQDNTQWNDEDGDGYGDNQTGNSADDCPTIPGTSNRDRRGCPDADGDGFSDENDPYPGDATQWADTDQDGYGDNTLGMGGDGCPMMFGNSTLGLFGCPDQDGDGYADIEDDLPMDPTQWDDLDGDGYGDNMMGMDYDEFRFDPTQQTDRDGDGYGDNLGGTRGDACPDTPGNSTADRFGCLDTDGDGWSDAGDGFPEDAEQWSDADGDGYEDSEDAFPFDPTQWYDTDEDGFGDNRFGSNADRFPFDPTQWYDIDGDGYGDNPDGQNYDAFLAEPSQWSDVDGDGCGDNPAGRNPDLFLYDPTQCEDNDGDGWGDNLSGNNPDPYLFDFDNDGYNDSIDVLPKLFSPGDLDNDGTPDAEDAFPSNPLESSDFDGDMIGDNQDPDDDNDGVLDDAEINAGTDPFDASSKPVDSFEIILPGTSIGLGAWDLIGVFVGIPFTLWILVGIATRGNRQRRFEEMLRGAERREDLEDIALAYERAVMMRMLGPHQAIRLERLRTELDDELEQAMHATFSGQTSQASKEAWDEYERQKAAYEAAQSTASEGGEDASADRKDVPDVPTQQNELL